MEFKQLEMFVAAAEERSVLRAAERVLRTQPAVSMALARLEKELGAALFLRIRGRGLELTSIGQELCLYAKQLLALRDEAQHAVMRRVACAQGVGSL